MTRKENSTGKSYVYNVLRVVVVHLAHAIKKRLREELIHGANDKDLITNNIEAFSFLIKFD